MGTLEFLFEGMPAGIFQCSQYPTDNGRYPYMPYRGPGHLLMGEALKKHGRARCYYEAGNGERVYFNVVSCPEYGVLELAGFR